MADSRLSTVEQLSSIWRLGGLTFGQLAKRVYDGISDNNLLGSAAALAYNFVLALFPLLIFLLSVLGLFASRGTALREQLVSYFSSVLPPAAATVINHTLNEVMRNASNGKVTFGIVLTIWFASGGMTSMISALNGVYEVRESRFFIKVRVIAFMLTVAISVLVVLALLAVLTGGRVVNVIGNYYGLRDAAILIWKVGQFVVAITFIAFSFSLIYYFGPDVQEQHWYWITPGSLVGVLLWVAASFGFRVYLHFFNSYGKTYGSLGAVMILLIWLYVTGFS